MAVSQSAAGAASARDKAGIVRCLNAHRVLSDAGASQYLPAVVIPRSRQIAISFPFTPGEVGLAGLIIVTPSVTAARAAIGRMIVYSAAHGSGSPARIRTYIEQRGPLVVGWWAVGPKVTATKVLTTCLGRRTDR